jgi:hypothetical protein
MPIIAKNMIVGGVDKTIPPTEPPKPKKEISRVNLPQPQVTKELPKYVTKEHGELTRKINTKSQYMRDIFDLDS